MDFLKNAASQLGNDNNNNDNQQQQGQQQGQEGQQQQSGGGGLMEKLNSLAGGGAEGEAKEDYLDKAYDYAQERVTGKAQNNEDALEQAQDEMITDKIRDGYKQMTGKEFFVADK